MTTITTNQTGLRRRALGGFTLLEMILVISVILFLMAFLVAMASSAHMDSQKQATRSLVQSIETALQNYYGLHGDYPPVGGNNSQNRQNLYIYLTEEKYGKCMNQIPKGAIAYEPWGTSKGKPYFVDAWGSQIYFVAFNKSGLKPNPTGTALQYQYMWGVNGGVPLVWSIGPDRKGWDAMLINRNTSSTALVRLMYLETDGDNNEDNISNFRDIPLEYVK
jgi:type II secretory pathway pseudopilin PulG